MLRPIIRVKKEKLFVSELFWSVSSAPIFVLLSQKKLAIP
jgi:hypothetical protein